MNFINNSNFDIKNQHVQHVAQSFTFAPSNARVNDIDESTLSNKAHTDVSSFSMQLKINSQIQTIIQFISTSYVFSSTYCSSLFFTFLKSCLFALFVHMFIAICLLLIILLECLAYVWAYKPYARIWNI